MNINPENSSEPDAVCSPWVLIFLFHSKFYRAQDSNLDLLEINVIQLSLPLDEHDFSFDEIAEKIFFYWIK